MNKEYKKRMECAEDAANQFFEEVKNSGNIKMLENDEEIRELYLKAYDVADAGSEEEKNFYFNFADFHLYKGIFMVNNGAFDASPKKSFTTTELKPVYENLTFVLDDAIEKNDRNKSAYEQRKADIISSYNAELLKHGITVKKGGCYIATTVYGSYDCPQVWTLRRYRDGVLSSHHLGRAFIRVYYAASPTLVKLFGQKKWFSSLWRGALDMLISKLQSMGYEDTPYTDTIAELRKEKKGC